MRGGADNELSISGSQGDGRLGKLGKGGPAVMDRTGIHKVNSTL